MVLNTSTFSLMKAEEGEGVFCFCKTGSLGSSEAWSFVSKLKLRKSTVSSPRGVNPRPTLACRCAKTELITPDLICPSTYQLLWNSGGDSGPDFSFDKSASPKRLFSSARVAITSPPIVTLFGLDALTHDDPEPDIFFFEVVLPSLGKPINSLPFLVPPLRQNTVRWLPLLAKFYGSDGFCKNSTLLPLAQLHYSIADLLTKGLGTLQLRFLLDKLGSRDLHAPT
ncbi:hypothetical protein Tco_0033878 [Tanacetum coccineum]